MVAPPAGWSLSRKLQEPEAVLSCPYSHVSNPQMSTFKWVSSYSLFVARRFINLIKNYSQIPSEINMAQAYIRVKCAHISASVQL